jgi:hypothetical protein
LWLVGLLGDYTAWSVQRIKQQATTSCAILSCPINTSVASLVGHLTSRWDSKNRVRQLSVLTDNMVYANQWGLQA